MQPGGEEVGSEPKLTCAPHLCTPLPPTEGLGHAPPVHGAAGEAGELVLLRMRGVNARYLCLTLVGGAGGGTLELSLAVSIAPCHLDATHGLRAEVVAPLPTKPAAMPKSGGVASRSRSGGGASTASPRPQNSIPHRRVLLPPPCASPSSRRWARPAAQRAAGRQPQRRGQGAELAAGSAPAVI